MKIGILRETKVPLDSRVALTPKQCAELIKKHPKISIVVQSSTSRCFSNDEYVQAGIEIVNDINDCDILLGVKEVNLDSLISNKTYFYFSHTIKKQPYNRSLLKKMIDLRIKMVDYEVLKNLDGSRVLGFGRYAGIVGAYNAFLTYGLKSGLYNLKPAFKCQDRYEMEKELNKIILKNERIVVTGKGRVGKGILELLSNYGLKQVSVNDFLNLKYNEPVFVHLDTLDYNERSDGVKSDLKHFYKYPHLYKSTFMNYAKKSDIFIAGHFYGFGSPFLLTKDDIRSQDFNFKVIADISCDIDGPIASTIRSSTIQNPIYGYDVIQQKEVNFMNDSALAVMAVSNLPCELPKDASKDFGDSFLDNVIPHLINDKENVVLNATICEEGDLTPNFEYLRDYINKN